MLWILRIVILGVTIFVLWWGDDGNQYCGSQTVPCEATLVEQPDAGECTIDPLTGLMQGNCGG